MATLLIKPEYDDAYTRLIFGKKEKRKTLSSPNNSQYKKMCINIILTQQRRKPTLAGMCPASVAVPT